MDFSHSCLKAPQPVAVTLMAEDGRVVYRAFVCCVALCVKHCVVFSSIVYVCDCVQSYEAGLCALDPWQAMHHCLPSLVWCAGLCMLAFGNSDCAALSLLPAGHAVQVCGQSSSPTCPAHLPLIVSVCCHLNFSQPAPSLVSSAAPSSVRPPSSPSALPAVWIQASLIKFHSRQQPHCVATA